jgi:hypothetical protein
LEETNSVAKYEEVMNELYSIIIKDTKEDRTFNQREGKNKYTCEHCKQIKTGQF